MRERFKAFLPRPCSAESARQRWTDYCPVMALRERLSLLPHSLAGCLHALQLDIVGVVVVFGGVWLGGGGAFREFESSCFFCVSCSSRCKCLVN